MHQDVRRQRNGPSGGTEAVFLGDMPSGRMTCFPALDAQKSPKLFGRDCSCDSASPERIHTPPLDSPSVELRVMNNPDQDTLIRALEDARRILGEYIDPGPRDATRTVEHLLAVLDRNDVVHALDRIKRRRVIRLVE
jgi:hypothetical protein